MGLINNILNKNAPEVTKGFFVVGTSYHTREIYDLVGRDGGEKIFPARITQNTKTGYSKYRILVGKRTVGYPTKEAERYFIENNKRITKIEVKLSMNKELSDFKATLYISTK